MAEKLFKIGEAAEMLKLKTYVLRFWEMEFPQLAPTRTQTGQRLYTEKDLAVLRRIKHLLHERGLTIEGARKQLAEEERGAGAKASRTKKGAPQSRSLAGQTLFDACGMPVPEELVLEALEHAPEENPDHEAESNAPNSGMQARAAGLDDPEADALEITDAEAAALNAAYAELIDELSTLRELLVRPDIRALRAGPGASNDNTAGSSAPGPDAPPADEPGRDSSGPEENT